MKIALVGSSGGHLTHLKQLEPVWHKHDRFWVTFDKPDASSYLTEERWYKAYSQRIEMFLISFETRLWHFEFYLKNDQM